jgi:AAHS family benzoate transporter-like MFS transporter
MLRRRSPVFAAVFSRQFAVASILLGLMSFCGLLLTYGLNTWLPKIMEGYGYGRTYALFFPLALNLGAVVGGLVASRLADQSGPQRIIACHVRTCHRLSGAHDLQLSLADALHLHRRGRRGNPGHPGAGVRIPVQLLHHQRPRGRRRLVRQCGPAGRSARSDHRRLAGRSRHRRLHRLLHLRRVALLGALVTVLVPRQRRLEEAEHRWRRLPGAAPKESWRPLSRSSRGGCPGAIESQECTSKSFRVIL